MKTRTKAEMAEYQRNRRNKQKQTVQDASGLMNDVTPDVIHPQNVTPEPCNTDIVTPDVTPTVTPEGLRAEVPANYGLPDCTCQHCRQTKANKSCLVLNHGAYKTAEHLAINEINRVSLPGDVDYSQPAKTEPGQLSVGLMEDIARINIRCEEGDKQALSRRIQNAKDYQRTIANA
jgi:hypothetical protein